MMHTITQIILLAMLDEQTMFKSACENMSLDFFLWVWTTFLDSGQNYCLLCHSAVCCIFCLCVVINTLV
jgi:hypothetical protein